MVHLKNGLIFYLLFHFFKPSITRLEPITIVRVIPGDEGLLNCSESSSIIIGNVSVQNISQCENRQTECNLNMNDHELIKECDGSSSCHLNGSLLTSACLWDDLHFNMSYTCKVPYVYVGCYVDDIERVLGDEHKDNQEMSANICYGICTKSQKWKEGDHFGTQYAKECSCGDGKQLGYNPYFERNISECYHDCLGHKEEKCGGNYRMSVYRITKRDNNYSCLDMDQKRTIKDCATNHLQEEILCIKFDASSENQNQRCSGIGNKLYDFCRREHPNRKCVFNMKNVLKATNENQPSRSISIEYLCKERASIPTESSLTTAAIPMYPIIVAVLVVAIIAAFVFIIVVFYRKRKKAMNSQPCEIQQNQINTDNVYFSNSNREHYTEITRNSIPIVYENINDNKTISCEPQKIANFQQKGNNYESLSSNRNSSVHMYEFTKCVSKEKDLSQYQSLTNPPASDIHNYESTELDLSQYQSLDKPSEKDIHTYASTTTIQ